MSAAAPIGVVVLAAGGSRRFGAPKLAVPVAGVALLRRAVLAAHAVGDYVVVVTGADHAALEPLLAGLRVTISHNTDWRYGMGASIAHGMRELHRLAPDSAAAVVMPADQPHVGAAQLLGLTEAFARGPHGIIAASYAGVCGAPCLFDARYFAELAALDGDDGARAVLRAHAHDVATIAMPEAALDIDTPEDLAAWAVPPRSA